MAKIINKKTLAMMVKGAQAELARREILSRKRIIEIYDRCCHGGMK